MDITNSGFGAILHKEWKIDVNDEKTIIGYWYEDSTEYYLDVPPQIRLLIVLMQNWLSRKYQYQVKLKDHMKAASRFFNGLDDAITESQKIKKENNNGKSIN